MIQVGDGFTFIEAIFTREAVNNYRKTYGHVKLSQMRDHLVKVYRWSLVLKQRDSCSTFNAHKNFGVYLSIEEFAPKAQYSAHEKQMKKARNVFEDYDVQQLIRNCRH